MTTAENIQSQFIIRFTSLPVVSSAFEVAANTYGRVKHVNPILEYTFSTAEKSVQYANDKAKPLVKRFEKQIVLADGLACKGLEKLEEKVPMITKPTDMIIEDTRALYNNTVKMGVDRYENVKSFGTNKVNAVKQYGLDTASSLMNSPYVKLVSDSVDGALSLTENCVDHYLPPLDEEKGDDAKKQPIVDRVTNLSSKIQRRVYRHTILKASNLKHVAEDSLSKYTTADVVKSTHENLNNAVSNAYTNATWLWEQLNIEPDSTETSTLTQRALTTARYTTRNVVSVFVTAKTTVQDIPTRVNHGITTIYSFSTNAYNNIPKVQPQELVTVVYNLKDSLKLEERVTLIVHGLVQTSALQWLLNNPYTDTCNEDLFEDSEIFTKNMEIYSN